MKSYSVREMNEISVDSITEELEPDLEPENCKKFKCDEKSCTGSCLSDWEQSLYKNVNDVLSS